MRYRLILTVLIASLLVTYQNVSAMTAISGSVETKQKNKGSDQPTGFFGGLKPDGTFVFKLAKSKGIRFYRLASSARLSGFPAGQTLQNLVADTPIRLIIENYRITVVEALGGRP